MRIFLNDTVALPVDFQERILPAVENGQDVLDRSVMLVKGLKILGVPFVVPRQYPKGLGDILPEMREALGDYTPGDKLSFSACGEASLKAQFTALSRKNVIVFGIEAHVCVLQSVIDLKELGYQPILVADCIGSRRRSDMEYAIARARDEGAVVTTAEAILFELTERAGTDVFKSISRLVK